MMSDSALVHVLVPVSCAIIVNGIIYTKGWGSSRDTTNITGTSKRALPPGYIIGLIWIMLFGMLGYAHLLLRRQQAYVASYAVVAMVLWCLMYPIVTGLDNNKKSKTPLINRLSLVGAFIMVLVIVFHANESRKPLQWLLPFIAWLMYVNVVAGS
jgi:tryptophan-rich sensory protein